ncbi:phosphatidylserine/phosphatidylglycerophosphate/cardiolipin synthase-like enzyme [Rhodococcus ruber]|uniref:phospholipase D-like domain-containing protein DpdK n=1 Tax=Rhodococcus ruber TaxID=1830 RepID=UPI001D54D2C1|nr:phospholipase D-like domain-containing protein DpdK [Rhodococcus ruber]MBP2210852.1 phosphatidylserine/phosphatidylglycerophosphate/cardiolipin synthase-like enzyme [Rhodococcus ruber]
MNNVARTVRTRPRSGLAIGDVLTAALVSELLQPSDEFWLVTGWVSDITVIDNSVHQFDAVVGTEARSSLSLSEVFALLTERGTQLHVATRTDPHNETFIHRLRRMCVTKNLHLYSSDDLHEKIMIGWKWVLKGSMNFTWHGTQRNEEALDFEVGVANAARQRLDVRTRWIGGQS